MRFEETAHYAAEHGFESIGTTLSVSPYQYTAIIREELERAANKVGVRACFVDYRPYYDNATQRSRAAGMYRQNYCACRFSEEEARVERDLRKQARKAAKEAEAAARREQHAAEEEAARAKRAEKAAYADKQARKRAILKQLREQER
ncbi:MAG: epoxyqueuosine reductase QueH [Eggerthellaceae bacterium]|nr:epoxyqueuosine reductase QueH [Eggerthellaceae bacterium]